MFGDFQPFFNVKIWFIQLKTTIQKLLLRVPLAACLPFRTRDLWSLQGSTAPSGDSEVMLVIRQIHSQVLGCGGCCLFQLEFLTFWGSKISFKAADYNYDLLAVIWEWIRVALAN